VQRGWVDIFSITNERNYAGLSVIVESEWEEVWNGGRRNDERRMLNCLLYLKTGRTSFIISKEMPIWYDAIVVAIFVLLPTAEW